MVDMDVVDGVEEIQRICRGVNEPTPPRATGPAAVIEGQRVVMERARAARLHECTDIEKGNAYTNLRFGYFTCRGKSVSLTRRQAASALGVTVADTYRWETDRRRRASRLNFVWYRELRLGGMTREEAVKHADGGFSLRTTYRWAPAGDPYGDRLARNEAHRFRAEYLIARSHWGYDMVRAARHYAIPMDIAREWERT